MDDFKAILKDGVRSMSIGKIKGLFFKMRKYPTGLFNSLQPQINRNEERSLSKSGD